MNIENFDDISFELNKISEITILFNTDYETSDNTETMNVFLDIYDIPDKNIILFDGTYCEIIFNAIVHEVHASGNGDFSSHKIEIKPKQD